MNIKNRYQAIGLAIIDPLYLLKKKAPIKDTIIKNIPKIILIASIK